MPLIGKIHQINIKAKTPGSRGLPKHPVNSVRLTREGLVGDFNVYRHEELADDPDSAVLFMPLETLNELNREGWPISPGDIGENFTTMGIPYSAFSLERVFSIGSAEIQISRACDPCDNLYLLPYVGIEKGPAFLKLMLGRRGWYARVTREGVVNEWDTIESVT